MKDSHESVTRYPLQWPLGRPRTKVRETGSFSETKWSQSGETRTTEKLNARFKERAANAHPDRGGTDEMMMHVNRAREYALSELLG